jgi:DNA-binding winged helix-turn-helix (wHTH) protein
MSATRVIWPAGEILSISPWFGSTLYKFPRTETITAYLDSGELLREGVRLRLQSQPFQLLTLLLMRPDKVVTRDEIREKLWPADTFVDFDHSLGTAINKISAALTDSAEEPRLIETLPKRGYRLIGKIETSIDPASEQPVNLPLKSNVAAPTGPATVASLVPSHSLEQIPSTRFRRWLSFAPRRLAGVAALAVLLLASAAYAWRN